MRLWQRTRKASDTTANRARGIGRMFTVLFALCVLQLLVIQIFQSSTLSSEGERVRTAVSEIGAKRGNILDVNGVVLADSVQAYHIAVNQRAITTYEHKDDDGKVVGRGPAEAAKQLSPLLGMSRAELGGMMLGDSTYVYLKKNVDAVTYREIRKLDITGIEWESVFDRVYPNGNTAAPIIGAVNSTISSKEQQGKKLTRSRPTVRLCPVESARPKSLKMVVQYGQPSTLTFNTSFKTVLTNACVSTMQTGESSSFLMCRRDVFLFLPIRGPRRRMPQNLNLSWGCRLPTNRVRWASC